MAGRRVRPVAELDERATPATRQLERWWRRVERDVGAELVDVDLELQPTHVARLLALELGLRRNAGRLTHPARGR